jgi:hypothetical protein
VHHLNTQRVQAVIAPLLVSLFLLFNHSLVAAQNSLGQDSLTQTKTTSLENSPTRNDLRYDFYSESYSTTYFNGSVSQSRLRLLLPLWEERVLPYFGVNTSNDFTRNSNQRFADDFVSPTAGLLVKPFSFLGVFAEYRRLYRTADNELPDQENDSRYGAYVYYLQALPALASTHLELYAESVALDRFTSKPVTTAWLKFGKSFTVLSPSLSITPYLEGFTRESPNLMIGIDERSLRAGGKLKWQWQGFSAQLLGYNRFESNSVPTGWEGFLVLSADGGFRLWN